MSDVGIHLRNHHAAAEAGVDLARRVARRHRGTGAGPGLARIASDVAHDRDLLLELMATADTRPSRFLPWAARLGERLGRLKPNGRLLTPSPVSDVLELEALRGAVTAKRSGWDTLLAWSVTEPRLSVELLVELRTRADDQLRRLAALHQQVAAD